MPEEEESRNKPVVLLEEALAEYWSECTDRATGILRTENTGGTHVSGIKFFLKELSKSTIMGLAGMGKKGALLDQLIENKTLKPQTIQLYLKFLVKFIRFLASSEQWTVRLDMDTSQLMMTATKLANMSSTMKSDIGMAAMEVQAVECAKPMAMDAADLGEYLHGPRLDMVKAYLEQTRLTYQQQVEIRDCLIVTVNILNMKRAGDVPHLRMSELYSAVVPEEEDGEDIEIHVPKHKLAKFGKTSTLLIPKSILEVIKRYVVKVRTESTDDSKMVFTTLRAIRGKPRLRDLTCTQISKLFSTEWSRHFKATKQGDRDSKTLTATMCRKVAATQVRDMGASREDQGAMAKQMTHSLTTADRYYDKSTMDVAKRDVVKRVWDSYEAQSKKKQRIEEEEEEI